MEWCLDPSLDWSSHPGPPPPLPLGTECPGGEPQSVPSPPMDMEYLDGDCEPQINPVFTHGHDEPYLTLPPTVDTGYPGGQLPTGPMFFHKLDVKCFRKVNSLIRDEMFEQLLELIKINGRERQPAVNLMNDPVLSVVISAKKTQLAVKLIKKVDRIMLSEANFFGDTPLHIAAVEGDTTVAKELLLKDPSLKEAVNIKEETALHKAAMYGQESMFWCLVQECGMESTVGYRKADGSTVLHCAIMGNAPKLALDIARTYGDLRFSRNEALTPLQLMVTIPNFFRSQIVVGSLESFFYKLIPLEEDSQSKNDIADEEGGRLVNNVSPTEKDDDYYGWTWAAVRSKFPTQYATILDLMKLIASWLRHGAFKILKQFFPTMKELEKQKKRYAAAMQLVQYLANDEQYDFYGKGYTKTTDRTSSWSPSDLEHEQASGEDAQDDGDATEKMAPAKQLRMVLKEVLDRLTPKTPTPNKWNEPPLIIAAERGLHDFVRKILQVCPQSVTYLDSNGRNVLQVAVVHGHKEVVSVLSEMLQGSTILPSWLCTKLDNWQTNNTILHLAAENSPAEEGGDAVQLHHELKWFEMVEKLVPKELVNSRNKAEKTAKELFTEKHEKTLKSCKTELVGMGTTCTGLLAAVVFASSFSIPGDKEKDVSGRLAFKIFSHAYVIGFGCAATALVLFLSFVIMPYKERYFRRAIPMQYFFACLSFALALVAFLVSFVCNFVLQIYGDDKTNTTNFITLVLELLLFPVACIALLLYHGAKFGPSFIHFWR